ncbi:MAG: hypothetical protein FWE88_07990 [Phycisphaerae bacterium]|nr:hypothetical protein [Phycisphaerae bacterium]
MQATEHRTVRRRTVLILCGVAFVFSLWHAAGMTARHTTASDATGICFMLSLMTGINELLLVLAVMTAAGGWGYLAIGWLMPRGEGAAPRGLVAVTAILAGYWLLSTALLAVGSFTTGGLKGYIWWPVVGVGIALAAVLGRKQLTTLAIPAMFDARFLHWLVAAIAVGAWVAGAVMPPGMGLFGDGYDVLLYHLQLPREYLVNQHIAGLEHNVYSHYPLHQEMLFLLMMILRGGAYEGMYAAQFSHGIMAALAAVAMVSALRPADDRRARYAMLLLATTPFVLYLSWIAFAELSEVLCLTLAVLWLRVWILSAGERSSHHRDTGDAEKAEAGHRDSAGAAVRVAAIIGLCLGVACCAKYLSVGMIVLPVLAAMAVLAVSQRARRPIGTGVLHVALAGGVALAAFSPWLIRNAAEVGNPVFPLATTWLGKAHWTDEQQQRWNDGHAPDSHPPVPALPEFAKALQSPKPPPVDRPTLLYRNFLVNSMWGQITVLLFLVALGELLSRGRQGEAWDWSLLIVAGALIGVWVFATREMPSRFAVPVVVPMVLLAAGFLSRLASVPTNPLRRNAAPPKSGLPWGLAPAAVLLAIAVFVNLATVSLSIGDYPCVYDQSLRHAIGVPAMRGQDATFAANYTRDLRRITGDETAAFPDDAPFLLVGGTPFYMPDHSLYATPFDTPPLLTLAGEGTPAERIARLRDAGVRYLWVSWADLQRLASSYGVPADLMAEPLQRQANGDQPALRQIEELQPDVTTFRAYAPPEAPFKLRTTDNALVTWPYYTLYAMPGEKFSHWPEEKTDTEKSAGQ